MAMKLTGDYIIAYLALISGLSISSVAIYYSVIGLISIFSAAALPIMVMGLVLEISKLIATLWLKRHWSDGPVLFKSFFMIAVLIFMFITSMGIFGFLSKAHSDQAVPFGDIADKVALVDDKIQTNQHNIEAARKALTQMNEAVDQTMARSSSENGASKAIRIRKIQSHERNALQEEIVAAQSDIAKLREVRAPLANELRKAEAEVGPIKYIAALIYGDELVSGILERAVRWIIILIVSVFDPMAVLLLLASQHTFSEIRKIKQPTIEVPIPPVAIPQTPETTFIENTEKSVIDEVFTEKVLNKGDTFPKNATYGQEFSRTDYNPPRQFIFNGDQWVDAGNFNT